jgi:hypothetical protein
MKVVVLIGINSSGEEGEINNGTLGPEYAVCFRFCVG